MTGNAFNIGLSGLLAAQSGLSTASHNIANVNTEGYSRQRVDFETRQPQFFAVGFVGKGVAVGSIERLADQFLIDQLRAATFNEARAVVLSDLADQVDQQLGDAVIDESVRNLFSALQDANSDPSVIATRLVVLETTEAVVARFTEQAEVLGALDGNVNGRISGTIDQINALTRSIADLNSDIALNLGLAQGAPPNDLLDARDQLLVDLAELVDVRTQANVDGTLNVLVGSGQIVVAGSTQIDLHAVSNPLDGSRIEVAYDVAGVVSEITSEITGGALGGLIDFRDDVLNPARNAVGRVAAVFAMTMNAQHRTGMDLNGALGGDLFSVPAPQANSASTNTGTITVAFDSADPGGLTISDYSLTHDGTDFTLTRLSDGTAQTLAGAGPFSVDGLIITLGVAPAAGDEYLIQPTKFVARAMDALIDDPVQLALASPIRTEADVANIGDASISRGEILDETDAALLATTQIVFNDPPVTYQVNGVGPLLPYTSGANIDLNGWRIQLSGAPEPGDVFTIEANFGGSGDNGNGLLVSDLQFAEILEGGTATYQEAFGIMVAAVGATAQQARISAEALGALAASAQAQRDSRSGVNLDEEAASLLRFQQAYQASAQVIRAADEVFQALLAAVGN